jgi:hypothetical protein
MRHAFSYGYNHIATVQSIPIRLTATRQLLCLIRVEATKLAKAGFGDFLADARVSRLKGKCDENKEVYWLIQLVTVLDTNILTVNSKVQELK